MNVVAIYITAAFLCALCVGMFYWRKRGYRLEQRIAARRTVASANAFKWTDLYWFAPILGVVLLLLLSGFDDLPFAVLFIPVWINLAWTVLKNRRTLLNAGFSDEFGQAEFAIQMIFLLAYGLFISTMFY